MKNFKGPTDAVLLLDGSLKGNKLLLEFDGEQHFNKGYKRTSLKRQRELDDDKDMKAYDQGLKVQRLHYKDLGIWDRTIKGAIKLAHRNPEKGFILYSKSYEREPLLPWKKSDSQIIL